MKTMTIREEAAKLADRPYSVQLAWDMTVDGHRVYVASHPELPGCLGQGSTPEEAVGDLRSATIEFISSLLEDGLSIPAPGSIASTRTLAGPSNSDVDFIDIDATGPCGVSGETIAPEAVFTPGRV